MSVTEPSIVGIAPTPRARRCGPFRPGVGPTIKSASRGDDQHLGDRRPTANPCRSSGRSNPKQTRATTGAKVKTDRVDAAVLAQLLAAELHP